MNALLLTVFLFVFPRTEKPPMADRAIRLAKLINGRILGSQIRPGMLDDKVVKLLGGERIIFLAPGCPPHSFYYKHRLDVYYRVTKDDWEVDSVQFLDNVSDQFR